MALPAALLFFLLEGEPKLSHKPLLGTLNKLSFRQWYLYPFKAIAVTQGMITVYVLILRGIIHCVMKHHLNDVYGNVFHSNFGHGRTTHHSGSNP